MDQLDDDFRLTEDTSIIEKKRPTFLLVLCILTFVASGFGVLMGLLSFTGFNDVESTLRSNSRMSSGTQTIFDSIDVVAMQKSQDWINIIGLLASILCLTGALIMFKMKKIGFGPYVLGHIASIYGAYLSMGLVKQMADAMPISQAGDMVSMIGGASLVFSVIITIAFLIMYGLNLKHLK